MPITAGTNVYLAFSLIDIFIHMYIIQVIVNFQHNYNIQSVSK